MDLAFFLMERRVLGIMSLQRESLPEKGDVKSVSHQPTFPTSV